MKQLMKHFFILGLAATLLGCSSTQYDASELVSHIDQLNLKAVKLAIDSENVVLASQANERLFKLHHNALEVFSDNLRGIASDKWLLY